jgi:hypothetical protein
MALRIACDLDGTLANMEAALQREAEELFGGGVRLRGITVPADEADEEADAVDGPGLTARQMRRLWEHVRQVENFWLTLPEIEPGTVARLAAFAALHGWEILFLTQRPATAGETAQVQTQRWLEAHGFELPSVYVMNGSRGKVADALRLDAVLDDRPENCLDVVADSKARAFLVWRGDPTAVPAGASRLGIETVFSLAEALTQLEQLTVRRQRPEGLVGRLRAALRSF